MSTIGERLREERERLGYNQVDFGAIGGVQKVAQINYEKGKRVPDAGYLSAIAVEGADVAYIVTGIRSAPEMTYALGKPAPVLGVREEKLLENYRASSEEGKRAVEATASALTHGSDNKKRGSK